MGARVTCGSFPASTSTGDQPVSLPNGFGTPKAIAFFWSYDKDFVDPPVSVNNIALGIGFTDGTDHLLTTVRSRNNQNNTTSIQNKADHNTGTDATSIVIDVWQPVSGGLYAEASFTSFDSNGFTINWRDAPANSLAIGYMAWAGDGVSVKAGKFTTSATQNGDTDRTTIGFKPDQVLTASVFNAFDDTARDDLQIALGLTRVTAASQLIRSVNWFEEKGASVTSYAMRMDDTAAGIRLDSSGSNEGFGLHSFDSSGWTDRTLYAATAVDYMYLAVQLDATNSPHTTAKTYTIPSVEEVSGDASVARPHCGLMFTTAAQTEGTSETGNRAGMFGITGWGLNGFGTDGPSYFSIGTGGDDGVLVSAAPTDTFSVASDLYPVYMLDDDGSFSTQTGDSGAKTHTDGVWADQDTLDNTEWKFDWHNTDTWGGGQCALLVTTTDYQSEATFEAEASISASPIKIALKDVSTTILGTATATPDADVLVWKDVSASVDAGASAEAAATRAINASATLSSEATVPTSANAFRSRTFTALATASTSDDAAAYRSRTTELLTEATVSAAVNRYASRTVELLGTASMPVTSAAYRSRSATIDGEASVSAAVSSALDASTTILGTASVSTATTLLAHRTTVLEGTADVLAATVNILDVSTDVLSTGHMTAFRSKLRFREADVLSTGNVTAFRRIVKYAATELAAEATVEADAIGLVDLAVEVSAEASLNVQAARHRFADFIMDAAASVSTTAEGGQLSVLTQYSRIQDALLDAVEAATFPVVRYNRDTGRANVLDLETGHPISVHAEEVSGGFANARRVRTHYRQERTEWPWEVQVHFTRKVALELFENQVTENPPLLPRTVDLPQQVRLVLKDSRYLHPLEQGAPGGTRALFKFDAELSPV